MPDFATGQGYYLAELVKHYHRLRPIYLEWAEPYFDNRKDAIATYQRSLLAWYEARIDPSEPYAGDVMVYLRAATAGYTNTLDDFRREWEESGPAALGPNPLNYLPRSVTLDPDRRIMLEQWQKLPEAERQLLLLAYYHQLSDHRLHKVLNLGKDAESATRARRVALRLVRDGWRAGGLTDDDLVLSPEQAVVVDRYARGELPVDQRWEVEARRSSDTLFRRGLELREDWEEVIKLLGRQDTLENLRDEEQQYAPPPPQPGHRIDPARSWKQVQGILTVLLIGVLGYLLFITFWANPERDLFAKYFRPFPNITKTEQYEPDPLEEELGDILIPYDQRNYLAAYDELLPAATAYPSAPLYLGVCALALDNPQRAIDWFGQYLPGDRYHPYARWYLALAYLAQERGPLALEELSEIASVPGHPYEQSAARLIEDLE